MQIVIIINFIMNLDIPTNINEPENFDSSASFQDELDESDDKHENLLPGNSVEEQQVADHADHGGHVEVAMSPIGHTTVFPRKDNIYEHKESIPFDETQSLVWKNRPKNL